MNEVEILARAKQGDKQAKREIMTRYLPMIEGQARVVRRKIKSLEHDELVAEGCIGVDSAIRAFDPNKSKTLATIAWWYIRSAMERSAWGFGAPVRVPRRVPAACAARWPAVVNVEEIPAPESNTIDAESRSRLNLAINDLPRENQRLVVKCRLAGFSQADIGVMCGVTGARIQRIESDAMRFLTKRMGTIP